MKEKAISGPMMELLAEIVRQGVPEERIRRLNESGLFSKILKANLTHVNMDLIAYELGICEPPSPITITRNYCSTLKNLRELVQRMGCYIGPHANAMLDPLGPTVDAGRERMQRIKVAIVSGERLGLPKRFTLRQVIELGANRRLQKCLPEDALALRIEYLKQPYEEYIRVAMDPIPDRNGELSIFRLGCTDEAGLLIDGMYGDPDREWERNKWTYWAFIDPRK